MASRFMSWLRSPAAKEYFFSAFLPSVQGVTMLMHLAGTHFWGPVRSLSSLLPPAVLTLEPGGELGVHSRHSALATRLRNV